MDLVGAEVEIKAWQWLRFYACFELETEGKHSALLSQALFHGVHSG